jgi:hypothetical protein
MKITYRVTEVRKRQIIFHNLDKNVTIEGVYYEGCTLVKQNNKLIIL